MRRSIAWQTFDIVVISKIERKYDRNELCNRNYNKRITNQEEFNAEAIS
ncbi:MAG: hypothetical protein GX852_06295 [Clostridiales bacterium]|nr:hypothetical protein [Clostridiales bacterium]